MAALGLCYCTGALSSCSEWGLVCFALLRLLTVVVLLLWSMGPGVHGLGQLWPVGSVAEAHGLSCSAVYRLFLDQGSNPYPLHWQVDFLITGPTTWTSLILIYFNVFSPMMRALEWSCHCILRVQQNASFIKRIQLLFAELMTSN